MRIPSASGVSPEKGGHGEGAYRKRREKPEEDLFYHREKLIEALNNTSLRHANLRREAVASSSRVDTIKQFDARTALDFPFCVFIFPSRN